MFGKNKKITEEQVLDSMRGIIDPDLGKDIVTLGFIKKLSIENDKVSFTVELTTPSCPVKEEFRTQCHDAVSALPGVKSVEVELSSMTPKKQLSMTDSPLKNINSVIAVSSCKGGVGKSSVAGQLARALQKQGLRVGLLDTDIYGPSVPTLFNVHRPQLMMRDDKIIPVVVDDLKLMSLGFVLGDSPAVLRGPMVSGYVQQILNQTEWGDLDYLIIDLPPGTGDIQLTLVQQAALDGAIIVTTPHSLSLVDVTRGILMFEKVDVPVLGIVENMSYFECDDCHKKHHIFGSSAQKLKDRFGLTTLAEFPIIQGFSNLGEKTSSAPQETLDELVENLHRAVGMSRMEKDDQPVVTAESGHILVKWPDGTESKLPNKMVRASCLCAQCVHEYSGEQILDVNTIPDTIEGQNVEPLGNYAVSIAWSDTHSSGIFTWDHLRELGKVVEV